MILVAVGTQFPFDRLIEAVDLWAEANGRTDVVAQIGPSKYKARAIRTFDFMNPEEFRRLQVEASFMVSHAGMGSILTAMEFGKAIIIMPRDHTLGEHRNAHQQATANRFKDMTGVHVAMDVEALKAHLEKLSDLPASVSGSAKAPKAFTDQIRAFIEGE